MAKGDLPVKYSIQAEEGAEQLLAVDNEGRITTREELDGLEPTARTFRLVATDGRRKATADLEMTILSAFDCVPEFVKGENDLFHIDEVRLSLFFRLLSIFRISLLHQP